VGAQAKALIGGAYMRKVKRPLDASRGRCEGEKTRAGEEMGKDGGTKKRVVCTPGLSGEAVHQVLGGKPFFLLGEAHREGDKDDYSRETHVR